MWSMSGRPCNPGSDLRALWQTLLGDMALPQCGTPDQAHSSQDRVTAPLGQPPPDPDQASAARRQR
jgi:hypothetical protein